MHNCKSYGQLSTSFICFIPDFCLKHHLLIFQGSANQMAIELIRQLLQWPTGKSKEY